MSFSRIRRSLRSRCRSKRSGTRSKERQGDNKTPEGTYVIDARNRDSRFHLSLHISYPNERDKNRAKELGDSPGGDIMIHGIKNGSSWAGDAPAEVDWMRGS